jgi:hypothetical protein
MFYAAATAAQMGALRIAADAAGAAPLAWIYLVTLTLTLHIIATAQDRARDGKLSKLPYHTQHDATRIGHSVYAPHAAAGGPCDQGP